MDMVVLMTLIGFIGAFVLGMGFGSAIQRAELMDEWKRVEAEWADLAREKARWAGIVSRISSPSNGPKSS